MRRVRKKLLRLLEPLFGTTIRKLREEGSDVGRNPARDLIVRARNRLDSHGLILQVVAAQQVRNGQDFLRTHLGIQGVVDRSLERAGITKLSQRLSLPLSVRGDLWGCEALAV